ncbi:hypothetical protein L227DRAFT_602769 [Lentinus tigrinus ALCF2SS1-6]|uniref:Uncharacterized protein n=1 Tax=Lentinus tigrinus ALCF2SS1-6 TaxID=1328759 RepID=A0A5C2S073_9APHY|nr:hypothetical protein L227DRAFT_602769 [Lentinus tigrinus ALCF2SS1-6]
MTGFIGQNSFATGFATCSHTLPSLATFFPLLHLSAPRSTCLPPIAINCHLLPSQHRFRLPARPCHSRSTSSSTYSRLAPFCTILPLFAHLST